jgi:hypothetical protein
VCRLGKQCVVCVGTQTAENYFGKCVGLLRVRLELPGAASLMIRELGCVRVCVRIYIYRTSPQATGESLLSDPLCVTPTLSTWTLSQVLYEYTSRGKLWSGLP